MKRRLLKSSAVPRLQSLSTASSLRLRAHSSWLNRLRRSSAVRSRARRGCAGRLSVFIISWEMIFLEIGRKPIRFRQFQAGRQHEKSTTCAYDVGNPDTNYLGSYLV